MALELPGEHSFPLGDGEVIISQNELGEWLVTRLRADGSGKTYSSRDIRSMPADRGVDGVLEWARQQLSD